MSYLEKEKSYKELRNQVKNKIHFSENEVLYLFDFGSSMRDDIVDWIEDSLPTKKFYENWNGWNGNYGKKSITLIKYMVKKHGTLNVKKRLKIYFKKWVCDF